MKKLLSLFLALALVKDASGAVALDSNGAYQTGTNAASVTFAHTCTGDDRLIEVKVAVAAFSGSTISCSGVTYNGVALTQALTSSYVANASYVHTFYIFYLVAPATGANNVVVSFTETGSLNVYAVKAVSWAGVHQSSPLLDFDTVESTDIETTTTLTLDSEADGVVSDYLHIYETTDKLTHNASSTPLGENINTPGGYRMTVGASYIGATSASTGINWTIDSAPFNHLAVSWGPSTAAPAGPSIYHRRMIGPY